MNRNKTIIIIIASLMLVVFAAILVVAWSSFSEGKIRLPNFVSAETSQSKVFNVTTPAVLQVNNPFGDTHIHSAGGSQVKVEADILAYGYNKENASANLNEVKVITTQDGNTVVAKVEYPDTLRNDFHAQVTFTIAVPQETSVTVDAIAGNINLTDIQGQFDLSTKFGDIYTSGLKGGLLKVASNNGNVTIKQATFDDKPIDMSSDFGDLTLENTIAKSITLTSKSGDVILRDVSAGGEIRLKGNFGGIDFIGGKGGSLFADTNNGKVMLTNLLISGRVHAKTSFGDILMDGVYANVYESVTRNGSISLWGANGGIVASSDFGDVDIQQADNADLDVKTAGGSITFNGSLGNGPHTLKTDFGSASIKVPPTTKLDVDLQTKFGDIRTAFNVTSQGTVDEKHLVGKLNGGGAMLTVQSKNGDISLEKDQ